MSEESRDENTHDERAYVTRAPDFERWFSTLDSGSASLRAAFEAGDEHGADSQRNMIFAMLPDLEVEAHEVGEKLTERLRSELLRLQADELSSAPDRSRS